MFSTHWQNVYSSLNWQKLSQEKNWHMLPVPARKEAPKQTIDFDEQMNTNAALDLDENFYGDQN